MFSLYGDFQAVGSFSMSSKLPRNKLIPMESFFKYIIKMLLNPIFSVFEVDLNYFDFIFFQLLLERTQHLKVPFPLRWIVLFKFSQGRLPIYITYLFYRKFSALSLKGRFFLFSFFFTPSSFRTNNKLLILLRMTFFGWKRKSAIFFSWKI